jgi:hypothetical protein
MSAPEPDHCPNCFATSTTYHYHYCGLRAGLDNPPPALLLGTVLDGRYRIGRVLGHGGFGITYLAWDENHHLRLAIKKFLPRDSAPGPLAPVTDRTSPPWLGIARVIRQLCAGLGSHRHEAAGIRHTLA